MDSLDLSPFATTSDLQTALQQQSEAAGTAAGEMVAQLGDKMEGELAKLTGQIEELQVREHNEHIINMTSKTLHITTCPRQPF